MLVMIFLHVLLFMQSHWYGWLADAAIAAMIRIKAVDAQNILEVCGLTASQDSIGTAGKGRPCCNAVSIAETKYHPEMHPNAIYSNNILIGFFMYRREEKQADTAAICRFMIDDTVLNG